MALTLSVVFVLSAGNSSMQPREHPVIDIECVRKLVRYIYPVEKKNRMQCTMVAMQ